MKLKDLDELNREFQAEIAADYRENILELRNPSTGDELEYIKEIKETKETEIKSLSELNREFQMEIVELPKTPEIFETSEIFENPAENKKKTQKKKRGMFALISDILFYLAIFMVLFAVLTSSPGNNNGTVRTFMGYSYFTVLTPSMQDEIPKGSFILVKKTEPQELNTGDNITFMKDANTSVTHKITNIYENYENSGAKGFQTKGVNNADPDKDIVYEANIVGKVIFVIPGMGAAISYLKTNIYIIFIIFGLCILLSFLLRLLFGKSDKPVKSAKSAKFIKSSESLEFTDSEWTEIENLMKKYKITYQAK